MSGVFDILEPLPERAAKPRPVADTRPEPGLLAQTAAAMRVQVDTVGDVQTVRRGEAYRPLIDALIERGLPRDYLMRGGELVAGGDVAGALQDYNYDTVFNEARKAGVQGLPATRAEFERQALRRDGGRDADQALLARGRGAAATVAQFAGGMVGGFRDPVNLVTLPLGGFGRTVATRIASEAAVSALGAAATLPGTANAYAALGEDFTAADAALEVGMAAAAGGVVRGGIELAPHVDAAGLKALAPVRERFDQFFAERDAARALARAVPAEALTPEQAAALHVLTRESEIDAASPYARTIAGDALHRAKLADAAERLAVGAARRGAGGLDREVLQFFRDKGYSEGQARGIAAGIHAESGSDWRALNPTSGALGLGQHLGPRKAELVRRYGPNPTKRQQLEFLHWELQGGDHGGRAVLAHGDEASVLRAYVEKFMRPAAGAETNGDLARGMAALGRASETPDPDVAAALGGLDLGEDVPVVRPEALDAERPFVSSGGKQVPIAQYRPADIEVNAGLMQFKSGGDASGVTERLRGVQEWDPVAAGMVTVWKPLEGRPVIADGHQRLGLAKRLEANGHAIELPAFLLREADGYSARDARLLTALKNIGEGSGTATDAAKVIREGGAEAQGLVERRLPPRSPLVRDGRALARLSDEAFGAVVNDVIPEGHAAAIGHLAPDPETHLALVALLHKSDPANRRQAEAIVRQALDAGFTKEVQEELFGARDLTSSLFAVKARLLDRTLSELRRLKGAFGAAVRNADVLDTAGNRIDVDASQAAADSNARALGLVELLALRKGNAVNEALDLATQRLAAGEPIARVARDLAGDIRGLDLGDLERADGGADRAGELPGGRGRESNDPGEAGASQDVEPADLDTLEAEQDLGPSLFDQGSPAARAFDEDAGAGVQQAAESDWHDIRQAEQAQDDTIGPFGPVFEDVDPGDWPAVVARLAVAQTGEVRQVLHHPRMGLIDVVWGREGTGESDGYGLAKILRFHPEVVADLPAIIRNMAVAEELPNRVRLESPDHKAAIALDWQGEGKTWLLTAYARREGPSPAADDGRAAGAEAAQAGNFPALEGVPQIGELAGTDKAQRFDAADPPTFDLDDGKGPRTAAEIESEIAADKAGLEEIRKCLK